MKRIGNFLDDYSIVVKPLLVLIWALWGLQILGPIKKAIKEEFVVSSQKIDWRVQAEARAELKKLADKLVAVAEKEKSSYGPKRYFEDLRRMKEMETDRSKIFPPIIFQAAAQLQRIVNRNVERGLFTQKEISREADLYGNWLKEFEIGPDREQFYKDVRGITLQDFLSWFLALYFRTIPLVIFYYLIRMNQRRGVLETVLAGKIKLFVAIFLWPFFFSKYPFNVVREIRVEAELRRLKGLFRKLSVREVRVVRQIANSSNYEQWIVNYRKQNQAKFRRGLILALGGTIVFHLLLFSSISRAGLKTETEKVSIRIISEKEQSGYDLEIGSDYQHNCQSEASGIVSIPDFLEAFRLIAMIVFKKEICYSMWPEPIDHVPFFQLFGSFARTATQTVLKGWSHECKSGHSVGCSVCFQFSFRC